MPNIFAWISPVSILIGIVGAAAALALLWPMPNNAVAVVGVGAFLGVAVLCELVRRVFLKKS